ncbi:hypothetical protein GGF43_002276 [Coemansia sp. RSA 2618]|nr:hypothetical protein GGF43_002276 [Coemansia sp. RSA 2618]
MSLLQRLRENKRFLIGLVVAPLGLYTGVRIKEWRTESRVTGIRHEVQSVQQPISETPNKTDSVREEIQNLREARAALLRQESLLKQELDSISAKLKRLDRQDAKQAIKQAAKHNSDK